MPEGYTLYNAQDSAAVDTWPQLDLSAIQKAAYGGATPEEIKNLFGLMFSQEQSRTKNRVGDIRRNALGALNSTFRLFNKKPSTKTPTTSDNAFCDPSSPLYDPQFCALISGEDSLGGTAAVPPVTDILGEMRLRRQAEAEQANIISSILMSNIPRGQKYYPGMEPSGLADVLLGIITGNGPSAAAGILPESQRVVRRTDVNVPLGQPSVQSDFGAASEMANSILSGAKVIQ